MPYYHDSIIKQIMTDPSGYRLFLISNEPWSIETPGEVILNL